MDQLRPQIQIINHQLFRTDQNIWGGYIIALQTVLIYHAYLLDDKKTGRH